MSSVSNILSQGIVISLIHSYIKDKSEYSKMYYKLKNKKDRRVL